MMSSKKKHVLCVSDPAFGHLIPMLEFARKLGPYHHVTFAVSARTASLLEERGLYSTSADGASVKLLATNDGVAEDVYEAAKNHTLSKFMALVNEGISNLLNSILSQTSKESREEETRTSVDLVVSGTFLGVGATRLLVEHKMPFILVVAGRLDLIETALYYEEGKSLDATNGRMLFMSATKDNLAPDRVVKAMFQPLKESVPSALALLVNSLEEFDEPIISRLRTLPSMKNKPIFCVGPLFPTDNSAAINVSLTAKLRQWLDRQASSSVIYVSFGTVMVPQPQQLKEISQALLRLNQPVVWSLRADYHIHLSEELMSLAQFGLEASDATDKRVLIASWVPQKMVLSHDSVGLFVTHCGWNSTIEALSEGKPMLCWPQFGDQLDNAVLVERNEAGVVIRDAHMSSNRVVLEDEILNMIEMAQTKGNGALTVKEKIRLAWMTGGSSSSSFHSLMQLIDSY